MTEEKWQTFKRSTKEFIIQNPSIIDLNAHTNPSLSTINFLNDKLEEGLIKSAKNHIPAKTASKGFRNLKGKQLVIIERFLSKCNRISRLLHNKIIDRLGLPGVETWQLWIKTADQISNTFDSQRYNWPTNIDTTNLS